MKICYVPWLHFHQPLVWLNNKLTSNLQKILSSKNSREVWNAKLILRAYKNPATYIKKLKKQGYEPKIMLDFSSILLESLKELGEKKILNKIKVEGERIGNIIKLYKEILEKFPNSIEIAGSAYSHCYFPATPEQDWKYQIEEWRNTFKKIFGSKFLEKVKGFWLPEMGVPGFEDKLTKLIKTIKENGYEWLILPLQALKGYERLSLNERITVACQPHLLKIGKESIPVIFRIPTYFIDQQSGCEAEELYRKVLDAGEIFSKKSKKPALVVPASDGENGNVMMNEFFPKTFVPFFKKKLNKVFSFTITEFLNKYYSEIKSEIKIKTLGASWVHTHRFWLEGTRRMEMVKKIKELSKDFSKLKRSLEGKRLTKGQKNYFEEIKKNLLIAETSCYVYWGDDFWFDQGDRQISFTHKKIKNAYKFL